MHTQTQTKTNNKMSNEIIRTAMRKYEVIAGSKMMKEDQKNAQTYSAWITMNRLMWEIHWTLKK